MRKPFVVLAVLLLGVAAARAEEVVCSGIITSVQGEGLVTKTYRFQVAEVAGADVSAVLEKSRQLALDRQNRAARQNPADRFRKISQLDMECTRGSQKFPLKSSLQTGR